MASELETKIIQDFTQHIVANLNEAAIIARTASGLGDQGLTERAFQTLLDIEPLIHDASILMNAASVLRRRDRQAPFG